jgi:hypothetical protein
MATKKQHAAVRLEQVPDKAKPKVDPEVCTQCGGSCVRGDFSSVANFGVTREPHFVTSYGWMQVKYDRATAIDAYMCLSCGHIQFFGRDPLAVLDPLERQAHLRREHPDLDSKLAREEKRKKELEEKGLPLEGDDHVGV